MKNIGKYLLFIFCLIISVFNCSVPEEGNNAKEAGSVTFNVSSEGQGAINKAISFAEGASPIAAVIVTVEKADGTIVYDLKRLSLLNMNGSYISEKLSLETGAYRLSAFFVTDAANNVLFATPLEGSPLAGQVQDPLPIEFSVQKGLITAVVPQVLAADAAVPQDFGYATFKFKIVGGSYPQLTITRRYSDPGEDGQWFTADDVMSGYETRDYKDYYTDNIAKFFNKPGTDGIWFTEDDTPDTWWWVRFEFGGSNQNGPGADGIWLTEDDTIVRWEKWDTFDPSIAILYNNPGTDGEWFTDDDIVCGYYKKQYDANNNEIKRIYYDGPGPDGIWYNNDDQIGQEWFGSYVVWEYEGDNNRWGSWNRQISYNGPGKDLVWFTADDDIRSYSIHEFGDGNKFFTREIIYVVGDDGIMSTADDYVVGYNVAENQY
jgi:hypothetical protein